MSQDDVSNAYLEELEPVPQDVQAQKTELAEKGELYPKESSPLADDGEYSIEIPEIVVNENNPQPIPVGGEVSREALGFWGHGNDIANGVVVGVPKAGTEIIHTLANIADLLPTDDYFSDMADEYAPRLTNEHLGAVGLHTPTTITGGIAQTATQFMTGFLPALGAMRSIGAGFKGANVWTKAAKTAAGAGAAGAIADLSVFNPYEKRLSNYLQSTGNPEVVEAGLAYLAADDSNSELGGRFKQALEGFILGKTVNGAMLTTKAIARTAGDTKIAQALFETFKVFKKAKQVKLEEAGVVEPNLTKQPAYTVNPATGESVTLDTVNPITGNGIDPTTGADVVVPKYNLADDITPVNVLPDVDQVALAHSILDGDIDKAAKLGAKQINLDGVDTPEQMEALLEAMSITHDQALEKGTRTWKQAASKEGGSISSYTSKVAGLDTEVVKSQASVAAIGMKAQEIMLAYREAPSPESLGRAVEAFRKFALAHAIDKKNAGEVARAMNIRKYKTRLSQHADNMLKDGETLLGKDEAMSDVDWERAIYQMTEMPNSNSMGNLLDAYNAPNWKDAMTEVYVNNLFSPVTLTKNVAATGISVANSAVERYAGAITSIAEGSGDLTLREANTYAISLVTGLREGWRVTRKSFMADTPTFSNTTNEFTQLMKKNAFRGEAFGIGDNAKPLAQIIGKGLDYLGIGLKLVPGSTRYLMATDEGMKAVVYRAEIAALAQREAHKAGLKGGTPEFATKIAQIHKAVADKNPSSLYHGLKLQAMDEAHRRTFTENLGENGTNIIQAMRVYKATYGVLPFVKTPINLVKYMVRRTPLAASTSDYVAAELKAGGARADLARAQISAGSMFLASGMALAGAGALQGDYTKNWSVNRTLRSFGIEPKSFVTEDGVQYSSRGFDGSPASMMMLAATTNELIEEYIREHDEELNDEDLESGILEIMGIPLTAYIKYSTNAAWGTGINQLMDAAEDGNWNKYLSRQLANAVVPAGNTIKWANEQSGLDPFAREIDSGFDGIMAKLPYYSRMLAPKATPLGDPDRKPQYIAMGLIPTFKITPPTDPLVMEINRLQDLHKDRLVMGGVVKELGGVKLDGNEKWNLSQFMNFLPNDSGQVMSEVMKERMAEDEYIQATDTTKEAMLALIFDSYKDNAKRALIRDALMFSRGEERSYAEEFRLYDYQRATPIGDHISNKEAIQYIKEAGEEQFGQSKDDYIQDKQNAVSEDNFIEEALGR